MANVNPIPEGYTAVTPYLVVRDAAKALDFYQKAFGASELFRMPGPGGKVMHAEMQIGNARVMLSEENIERGAPSPHALNGTAVSLLHYVADVDASFKRAVDAGAKAVSPPADMFWGDRWSLVEDPFGHQWQLATHKEDLSPDEMSKRMAQAI